jgi:hypothetical protein
MLALVVFDAWALVPWTVPLRPPEDVVGPNFGRNLALFFGVYWVLCPLAMGWGLVAYVGEVVELVRGGDVANGHGGKGGVWDRGRWGWARAVWTFGGRALVCELVAVGCLAWERVPNGQMRYWSVGEAIGVGFADMATVLWVGLGLVVWRRWRQNGVFGEEGERAALLGGGGTVHGAEED